MKTRANVFIAYSHKDFQLKEALLSQLTVPAMLDVMEVWHDGAIKPGEQWDADIQRQLELSDIVLLLISVNSLTSSYFLDIELKKILKQHDSGKCIAVPVILRHCEWKHSDLSKLQALPDGGTPVTSWPDQDKILSLIASKVKERALVIVREQVKKVREMELKIERFIRNQEREAALGALEDLRSILSRNGEINGNIAGFERQIAELNKIQRLREYLKALEQIDSQSNGDEIAALPEAPPEYIGAGEIENSNNTGLIRSLLANIESTRARILRKAEAASLDVQAEKSFLLKDYETARTLWVSALQLENKSGWIHRIRLCDERLRDRRHVSAFEAAIETARSFRQQDPQAALEMLESTIQKVKDDKLENGEEGEQVKERLKAAELEMEEIKTQIENEAYAQLLQKADEALQNEQFHRSLNHFLTAQVINPAAGSELEPKIQSSQIKLRVQKWRAEAAAFEKRKEYIGARGMYMALLELDPDDRGARQKIDLIDQIMESLDSDYAQARAKGEQFLMQRQFEEAIQYFEQCTAIKPDDKYALNKKAEANERLKTDRARKNARRHLNEGKDLFRKRQFVKAAAKLAKAAQYDPENEEVTLYRQHNARALRAELLFFFQLFGWAKQTYSNLQHETGLAGFAEQRLAECRRGQERWRLHAKQTVRFLPLILLLIAVAVLTGYTIQHHREKQMYAGQAIKRQETYQMTIKGRYADAFNACRDIIKNYPKIEDSAGLQACIDFNRTMLAASQLMRSAREAQSNKDALVLLDSASDTLNALLIPSGWTNGDTAVMTRFEAIRQDSLNAVKKRKEQMAEMNGLLRQMRLDVGKGMSYFRANKYEKALNYFEKASRGQYIREVFSAQERQSVADALKTIRQHFTNREKSVRNNQPAPQNRGLFKKLFGRGEEQTHTNNAALPANAAATRNKNRAAALAAYWT